MAGKVIQGFEISNGFKEEADVVVVGSGAGGGCSAAELAEGGLDVVVLEEGGYYTSRDFNQDPATMTGRLYREAGASIIMGKPNIIFSEGRCVGGSTVINGGMCWRTPEKILKKWQWEFGLRDFTPEKMEPYFEKVEERINVAPQHPDTISPGEKMFYDAARKLGYLVVPNRRNQKNCCGSNICIFGCPGDRKQSTLISYIPRAVSCGARVYSDCKVTEIKTKNGRAIGVSGKVLDRESGRKLSKFQVRAKVVVLAGGALQTPVLLLRNKLANSSGKVGRNFLCHPNAKAIGLFEEPVYYWKGVHQGHQVHEFIDEGIIVAMSGVHPALVAMSFPFYGKASLELMEKFNHMIIGGTLVDDTTTGRVKPGPLGSTLMYYTIDEMERQRLIKGVAIASEMMFTAGAKSVVLPFRNLERINNIDEITKIYEHRIPKEDIELLTVHAMGTTMMGANPKKSVTGPWGETHDVKNLFIVDAGVIPTSLGVNPQETIMALATRTCRYILENKGKYLNA